MMADDDLINQLIRHEGLRLKPYRCGAGKLTIGVGRNLEDVGITKSEAMDMLANDIGRCWLELEANYDELLSKISIPRQNVLVNMCFNLGITRLLQFKKMWVAIEQHDYHKAADEMLDSRWAKQVGERAFELAEQMRTGIY